MFDRKPVNVKKFIEQKVLGYNDDYTQTHVQHSVIMKDGSRETVYSTTTTDKHGNVSNGLLDRHCPFVTRPLNEVSK